MRTKWIVWQVAFPFALPIIVSAVVVLMWMTGNPEFQVNWRIVLEISPWALTFFALTLIGSTVNEFWPKLSTYPIRGVCMLVLGLAVAVYGAFIVIWRHSATFVPGPTVYVFAGGLFLATIFVCHQCHAKVR